MPVPNRTRQSGQWRPADQRASVARPRFSSRGVWASPLHDVFAGRGSATDERPGPELRQLVREVPPVRGVAAGHGRRRAARPRARAGRADRRRERLSTLERDGTPDRGPRGAIADHEAAVRSIVDWLRAGSPAPDAVGHRVVHGGARFVAPTLIDAATEGRDRGPRGAGPAAQRAEPGGHPRLPRRLGAGDADGRGLRHRLSRVPARAGRPVRDPRELGRAPRHPPVRLPRAVVRSVLGPVRRAHRRAPDRARRSWRCTWATAPRRRPSATGTLGRHVDGLHAARGPGDGHALRATSTPRSSVTSRRARGSRSAEVERWLNERSGLLGLSGTSRDMRDLLAARGDDRARAPGRRRVLPSRAEVPRRLPGGARRRARRWSSRGGIGEHAPEVRAAICERHGMVRPRARSERQPARDLGAEARISAGGARHRGCGHPDRRGAA